MKAIAHWHTCTVGCIDRNSEIKFAVVSPEIKLFDLQLILLLGKCVAKCSVPGT